MTIINEPGFYRLAMRSDKPEARAFQDWVTGTVLPSIRKHGAYVAPTATTQGVAQAAVASSNLEVAHDILKLLYAEIPILSPEAKLAIASDLLAPHGVHVPHPVVEKSWQMVEIAEPFGMSPTTASKYCAHLKISPAHGNYTYTTPEHGKKLVPQFRWNATGKAACMAVLATKPRGSSTKAA